MYSKTDFELLLNYAHAMLSYAPNVPTTFVMRNKSIILSYYIVWQTMINSKSLCFVFVLQMIRVKITMISSMSNIPPHSIFFSLLITGWYFSTFF